MARQTDAERLKALYARQANTLRQIRRVKSREKDQARRDDARRKIIAGALALEHLASNPGSEFGQVLFRLLDQYARPDERHLFDFLPVRETATEAAE